MTKFDDLDEQTKATRMAIWRRCEDERWEDRGLVIGDIWAKFLCDEIEPISEGRWMFSLRYDPRGGNARAWVHLWLHLDGRCTWQLMTSDEDQNACAAYVQAIPTLRTLVRAAVEETSL